MATFTSRGTFHATEQLGILGEGEYRKYNGPFGTCCGIDVSLCVVNVIEVARLTRWQLVFEPYRSEGGKDVQQVWLARGAPKRWFRDPEGFAASGLTLANAGGKISFNVQTSPAE